MLTHLRDRCVSGHRAIFSGIHLLAVSLGSEPLDKTFTDFGCLKFSCIACGIDRNCGRHFLDDGGRRSVGHLNFGAFTRVRRVINGYGAIYYLPLTVIVSVTGQSDVMVVYSTSLSVLVTAGPGTVS